MQLSFRPSVPEDIEWLVELRAAVLRSDLERLGRYDSVTVRERLRASFRPEWTRVIVVDETDAGSITVRREDDGSWIEHFYLSPDLHGRGVGSAVLRAVFSEPRDVPMRLNVLQGSAARRLYERFGFTVDRADDVDVFMSRPAHPH